MHDWLSRRAALRASLGAALGTAERRLWLGGARDAGTQSPAPNGVFNVRDFGAKGDGLADDSGAFQAAINAAGRVGGEVYVPASQQTYGIGAPLTLVPNITVRGDSPATARLRPAASVDPLLGFAGAAEAANLNLTLADLALQATTAGRGTALEVRNFSHLHLSHVDLNHFHTAVRASWGIGVKLSSCSLSWNVRAVEIGGSGGGRGTRAAGRQDDPFLDTVIVTDCSFAQNELDIHDLGSTRSLGGILIQSCSFFEAYARPVASKRHYLRLTNRKGIVIDGNWFEGGQASRTFILLADTDEDGARTGPCSGAAIFGNDFLQTGPSDTVGTDIAACEAAVIFGNCFEFSPGNTPIRLHDSGGRSTVGHNAYLTYPDRSAYADPLGGSIAGHQVMDPRLPARLPGELRVERRLVSGLAVLRQEPTIAPDASAADYFVVEFVASTPAVVQDPANPQPGQRITIDVRNRSEGPLGEITWAPSFLLAGPLANPAAGRRRTVTFYYDGTSWIETGRAHADI